MKKDTKTANLPDGIWNQAENIPTFEVSVENILEGTRQLATINGKFSEGYYAFLLSFFPDNTPLIKAEKLKIGCKSTEFYLNNRYMNI